MTRIQGYPVKTTEGKRVGHVTGESERAFVVECGFGPRRWMRALPKDLASVDDDERSVVMRVEKEMLRMSPKLKRGAPVDEEAMASWWALD
jgi:hypothetical protein